MAEAHDVVEVFFTICMVAGVTAVGLIGLTLLGVALDIIKV